MPEQVMVWRDSQGNLWSTQSEAMEAEAKHEKQLEVNSVKTILQTASRRMGRRGLPSSIDEAAEVAIEAFPDLAVFFGYTKQ